MILMYDKEFEGYLNHKVISCLAVALLVLSVFTILIQPAAAQPYGGEVWSTGDDGSGKSYFLEGEHLYFTITINASSPTEVEVQFKDSTGTLQDKKQVTTDDAGFYSSSANNVFFETNDKKAGTYSLNITSPEGTYTNETLWIVSNYSHGSSVTTWNTDFSNTPPSEREERDHFVNLEQGFSEIYLNATIKDASGNPLDNGEVTIQLERGDQVIDQESVNTDNEGRLSSSLTLGWNNPPGGYNVTILYTYDNPPEQQVVARHGIEVYEPDYSQNSQITLSDTSVRKDQEVGFTIQLMDQYGWPPVEQDTERRTVDLWARKGSQERLLENNILVEADGVYQDSFEPRSMGFEEPSGKYTLCVYDRESEMIDGEINGTRYATTETLTVFYLDITIKSEQGLGQNIFTQGQEIEIIVESNFPDRIDISIMNETYWQMEAADWPGQELSQGKWSAHYSIPSDVPDGEYLVYVNNTETGDQLDEEGFDVKKFELDLETDREAYLPGETVKAFYTVSNILDGSDVTEAVVEWRAYYLNESQEIDMISGSTQEGAFSFTIPKTASFGFDPYIEAWANDTKGRSDHQVIDDIDLKDISTFMSLAQSEYIAGETIYVDGWTQYAGSYNPVKSADLTVKLLKSGVVQQNYSVTATTDHGGRATVALKTGKDLDSGSYTVMVNGTKYGRFDRVEQNITVISEPSSLSILVDTNKPIKQYYQGDSLILNYTVTKQGKKVEAAVKYRIESDTSSVIYEYGYASGGTISFDIPKNFDTDDSLEITLWAYQGQKNKGTKELDIPVNEGILLFNVDQETFMGGENITFSYELKGVESPRSIQYQINNSQGHFIKFGEPTGGQFTFKVPSTPSKSYFSILEVVTDGNKKLTDTIQIKKERGYRLDIQVATESQYTTGVYKPGQKIKVNYKVLTMGDTSKPENIVLHYGFLSGDNYTMETEKTEGSFKLKIPKNAEGSYFIYASAGSNMDKTDEISVEKDPSWAQRKAVGGMSFANILLLILAIVALVIAILAVLMNKDMIPTSLSGKDQSIGPKKDAETEEEEKKPHEWSGPVKEETSEEKEEPPEKPEPRKESGEETSDEEEKQFEWDKEKEDSQIEPDEPKW